MVGFHIKKVLDIKHPQSFFQLIIQPKKLCMGILVRPKMWLFEVRQAIKGGNLVILSLLCFMLLFSGEETAIP